MSESKVLAVVNGKEITEDTVMKFLNDLGPQMAMQFQSPEGMKRVVDELVNQEVIYLDAIERGIDKEEEYLNELNRLKEGLLKQYAVNNLLMGISVTAEEVEKYYNENKEIFKKPESIEASHILVEGKDMADDIVKKINEGLSFEDAALEYSTCPSKEQGGNLGEFTRGQMVAEFDEAAFSMEVGPISEPIQTQFGYHIIKVTKKNEESVSEFAEIEAKLTQQLLGMKQQEFYVKQTDELKEKYDVVNNM